MVGPQRPGCLEDLLSVSLIRNIKGERKLSVLLSPSSVLLGRLVGLPLPNLRRSTCEVEDRTNKVSGQ